MTIFEKELNDMPELTYEQERKLRNYFRIQDAKAVLDCYDVDYSDISNEELLVLGQELEDSIYNNVGDIEYAVLEDLGYIKEEE